MNTGEGKKIPQAPVSFLLGMQHYHHNFLCLMIFYWFFKQYFIYVFYFKCLFYLVLVMYLLRQCSCHWKLCAASKRCKQIHFPPHNMTFSLAHYSIGLSTNSLYPKVLVKLWPSKELNQIILLISLRLPWHKKAERTAATRPSFF